jgi:hypothetical protein
MSLAFNECLKAQTVGANLPKNQPRSLAANSGHTPKSDYSVRWQGLLHRSIQKDGDVEHNSLYIRTQLRYSQSLIRRMFVWKRQLASGN